MSMQEVGRGLVSYVYSAYIDDRRAPDVYKVIPDCRPLLRVFVHIPLSTPATHHWRCLFWRRAHQFPLERHLISWSYLHSDVKKTKYYSLFIAISWDFPWEGQHDTPEQCTETVHCRECCQKGHMPILCSLHCIGPAHKLTCLRALVP